MRIRILGESLPMLMRCEVASKEDALRPDAHLRPKGTEPEEIMIHLKV